MPLTNPLRRIVSLSPSVTENLFAIGAGDRVVGVTTACDYPASAARLTRVGDFRRPSWERIVALHPDLLIVESSTLRDSDVASIREKSGCPVEVLRPRTVDDMLGNLAKLGKWCGVSPQASAVVRGLRARMKRVRGRVAGLPAPRVFVEVSETPLYAAGPGSYVDDLVRLAGGVNVVSGPEPFPLVGRERVRAARIDIYVVARKPATPGRTADPGPRPLAGRARVVAIDPDWLFRPTPRLVDGLEALAGALHPARATTNEGERPRR